MRDWDGTLLTSMANFYQLSWKVVTNGNCVFEVEKGEAVRQNLEYELAKAKRDISHEKRNLTEREAMMAEFNDNMKRQ